MDLPCVFFKPGVFVVAHGKVALCRVPDRKHTANIETHGKFRFSGSVRLLWTNRVRNLKPNIH